MNNSSNITAIILTFNEEKHILRCITSLKDVVLEIFIIDSFSTDRTIEIALENGVTVLQNKWVNYSHQFNWGLHNCPIKTDWVFRIDADEYLSEALVSELKYLFQKGLPESITGIYLKRRVIFHNKWIRHGGCYPIWLLRIFRTGKGICEEKWMDEHIKLVKGDTIKIKNDIIDKNLNSITNWSVKHVNYATREAIDILNIYYSFTDCDDLKPAFWGSQAERKKWLKIWYVKLPLFIRPVFYFTYRYFFLLGFLDGPQGLIWHFLQGLWYRFLVDANVFEILTKTGKNKEAVRSYLNSHYMTNF